MKLREKIWLWGLDPGADHFGGENGLAGFNRMTPAEGAYYFGTKNLIRASRYGFPKPPFDKEAEKLSILDKTIWPIDPAKPETVDEVIRIAKYHPHVKGAIIQVDSQHLEMYERDPQLYRDAKARLKAELGEDFELWMEVYAVKVYDKAIPWLEVADAYCIWCRSPLEIVNLDHYYNILMKNGCAGKKMYWGVHMWNFPKRFVLSPFVVRDYLNRYRQWIKEGKIEGIVLYSNTLADTKLQAAFEAKNWIAEHGDEEI
ncbi:MAG: hypothetical protein IJO61_00785 [Oscillospiraceae bacterium]|nr:hypothetical protein [Oscillospiraceae bacterium]